MNRHKTTIVNGERVGQERKNVKIVLAVNVAKAIEAMAKARGKSVSLYLSDLIDEHVEGQGYG